VARTTLICLSTFNIAKQELFYQMYDETEESLNSSERNTRNADKYKRFNYSFVCPSCMSQGLTTECPHMRFRVPAWQSEDRISLTDWMLRYSKQDRDVETLGVISGGNGGVFPRLLLTQFYSLPRVEARLCSMPIREIFVAVDPCTGKHSRDATDSSHFAIVTFYRDPVDGHDVLLGLESFPAQSVIHWTPRLRAHLLKIRERPEFSRATFVMAIENMIGTDASQIAIVARDTVSPCCVMEEDMWRDGLPTTGVVKRAMRSITLAALTANSVRIENALVTTYEDGASAIFDMLKLQLAAYKELKIGGRLPSDPAKFVLTGKSAGMVDDMCVMFQFGLHAMREFYRLPQYAEWRK